MKNIMITGANRGIGKEIARQLKELGHRPIAIVRNKKKSLSALTGICEEEDIFEAELSNSSSVDQMAAAVKGKFEKIDVLINNAGIISAPTSIMDSSDAEEVFQSNFFGPWRMVKAIYPLLLNAESASIINMSSEMGSHEDLLLGSYAAYRLSKAALNNLTIQLSAELASDNIKVNAMCPGWVKTDMGGSDAARDVSHGAETAVWLASNDSIPQGKFLRDKSIIPW